MNEPLSYEEFKKLAATWTAEELTQIARDFKKGKVVDQDKLAEAVNRGYVSQSAAMNRDW